MLIENLCIFNTYISSHTPSDIICPPNWSQFKYILALSYFDDVFLVARYSGTAMHIVQSTTCRRKSDPILWYTFRKLLSVINTHFSEGHGFSISIIYTGRPWRLMWSLLARPGRKLTRGLFGEVTIGLESLCGRCSIFTSHISNTWAAFKNQVS